MRDELSPVGDDFAGPSDPQGAAHQVDSWAVAALDGDASTADAAVATGPRGFSPQQRERQAGHQFLHGLLLALHDPDPTISEQRIQRVLAALDEPAVSQFDRFSAEISEDPACPDAPPRPQTAGSAIWSRWRRSVLSSIALGLALGVFFLFDSSSNDVLAGINKIIEQFRTPQDREYRITSVIRTPRGDTRRVLATLHTRGNEAFVLKHPGPLGVKTIYVGKSGHEAWLVPPIGPVLVTSNSQLVDHWIHNEQLATPYLDLVVLMMMLRSEYQWENPLTEQQLPGSDLQQPQRTCLYVRGRRNENVAPHWPTTMQVWAHPQTYTAERVQLTWEQTPQAVGVSEVTFELVNAHLNLSPEFYKHSQYHAAGRPVLHLPGEENSPAPSAAGR